MGTESPFLRSFPIYGRSIEVENNLTPGNVIGANNKDVFASTGVTHAGNCSHANTIRTRSRRSVTNFTRSRHRFQTKDYLVLRGLFYFPFIDRNSYVEICLRSTRTQDAHVAVQRFQRESYIQHFYFAKITHQCDNIGKITLITDTIIVYSKKFKIRYTSLQTTSSKNSKRTSREIRMHVLRKRAIR